MMQAAARQASAMRDHHALAHAAGELVRVVVDARARGRGCPCPAAARRRARARRLGATPQVGLDGLGQLAADRCRAGSSEVSGSWKIIASAAAAAARARLRRGQAQRSSPVERSLAACHAARVRPARPMMRKRP
jgi:hypothetical protein